MTQADEGTLPSTAGVIEKIVLKNFMCHDHLEVALGPQLNFIIGNNGSGKSAILTGLSVGLGSKASNTNRGKSLQNLIKRGRTTSRVTITLANVGHEAYMPELYGNKVTVERVLKKEGVAGYFLKAENGKTVSTKKADLDNMLHKYGIAIDNPMAFLSQDNARGFITSSSDAQKYKFYEIGSRIFQNKMDLVETGSNNREMFSKVATLAAAVEDAEKKRSKARKTYEQFKEGKNLKKERLLVEAKMRWAEVAKFREKRAEILQKDTDLDEDITHIDQQTAQLDQQLAEFDTNKEAAAQAAQTAEEAEVLFRSQCEGVREQTAEAKTELIKIQDTIKDAESNTKALAQEIAKQERLLKVEQKRIDAINGGSLEEMQRRLDAAESELREVTDAGRAAQEQLNEIDETQSAAVRAKGDAKKKAEEEIGRLKETKRHMLSTQTDPLNAFGPKIHQVMRAIRDTRFRNKPIGPLGLHVSVKDEYKDFSDIFSTVLTKTLESFLVTNSDDEKTLNAILRRHNMRSGVIVRRDDRFDYLSGMARSHRTFVDALDFDNEYVKLTMIDLNNIEKFVISKDRDRAKEILQGPDRNVMSVFSLFNHHSGQRSSINDTGAFRIDPVHYLSEFKMNRSAGLSLSAVKRLELEITAAVEAAKTANDDYERLTNQIRHEKEILASKDRDSRKRQKPLKERIYELKNKLSENADMAAIESLTESIQDLQNQTTIQRTDLADLQGELAKAQASYQALGESLKQSQSQLLRLRAESDSKRLDLAEFDQMKALILGQRAHYEKSKQKRVDKKAQYQEFVVRLAEEIVTLEAVARETMPAEQCPLMTGDTEQTLGARLNQIIQVIESLENRLGGSFEAAQQRLTECEARYENLKTSFDDFHSIHKRVDDDVMFRTLDLKETIENWTNTINQSFKLSLHQRGFDGELVFDHKKQLLQMHVSKDGSSNFRAVDSLSGGEKSFTQIALLLAIWQPMRAKIRGLDEFDVFMDSVNRKMAMKMMLLTLRKQQKSQTIFITPQDIADVEGINGPDVHIHRIADPKRVNNSENH
ncbi:hypothetical protein BABINDRAFT_162101 [Babjeviella inositovora NRRL Y-12698]|uniref:RecF/RecN/SMC N-terminal domain-containing protein n=1 Tax=Babjeviella inositovora NRRL Y-12698 TaxID=984486 RepID=A0A1E3QPN7_9ASCO|nr:uncharacterized protein BABINDRAFT_162101 [Babjeviella inositovora NRRL Y-12698]ODQ79032.1 hypothetical protein BABINDRAFT_162101 [Babjeviella inositovora NRRL Y-12698]